MKKCFIPMLFIITLLLAIPVYATDARATTINPVLTFTGTTANCYITLSEAGKEFDVTMKLMENGVTVKTWSDSGLGRVYMSKTATVKKGSTYKLLVTYSIDGETQPSAWVTKKCE